MYKLDLDLSNIVQVSLDNPIAPSDIKLYQLYRIVSPANTIDDTGKIQINEFINTINLRDAKWNGQLPDGYDPYDWNNGFTKHLPPLPVDWCWKNTVENKKIEADARYGTGKFAKRYRAYVLKTIGFVLPPKFVEELGQIAGRYSDQSTGSVVRFVDEFDWSAGDFGDPTSCFWGGRESARDMLKDNGAWAVQFFRPESIEAGSPKGYARAWVIPNYPKNDALMMFNGYGSELGEPSRTIARLLSSMVGMNSYEEVRLVNKDNDSGTLYINSGRGFVIGDLGGFKLDKDYDLDWPERIIGDCRHCDTTIYLGEEYQEHNDHYYCEECADSYLRTDDITHHTFDTEYDGINTMYITSNFSRRGVTEVTVCDDTLERYAVMCDGCSDHFHYDIITHVDTSGNDYCPSCVTEHTFVCDECSTTHELADVNECPPDSDSPQILCPVCASDWDDENPEEEEEEVEAEA